MLPSLHGRHILHPPSGPGPILVRLIEKSIVVNSISLQIASLLAPALRLVFQQKHLCLEVRSVMAQVEATRSA